MIRVSSGGFLIVLFTMKSGKFSEKNGASSPSNSLKTHDKRLKCLKIIDLSVTVGVNPGIKGQSAAV